MNAVAGEMSGASILAVTAVIVLVMACAGFVIWVGLMLATDRVPREEDLWPDQPSHYRIIDGLPQGVAPYDQDTDLSFEDWDAYDQGWGGPI